MTGTFRCFTRCPHCTTERSGESLMVNCDVLPQKFEVIAFSDDAREYIDVIESGASLVMPFVCQVIEPTLYETRTLWEKRD